MARHHLYAVGLLVLGLSVTTIGQTPTTTTTTTTPALSQTTTDFPDNEQGLILTMQGDYGTSFAHLRHLAAMPYYHNFSGLVPGIKFRQTDMNLLSLDVDYRQRTIYAYDIHYKSIIIGTGYNAKLDLDKLDFYLFHVGVSRGDVQVVVDWTTSTLYWTDHTYRWIVAASANMAHIEDGYYRIIVDTHLDSPDGIALDPIKGYLFWSDNGKHPKIERSDPMGKSRTTILSSHLTHTTTLEADHLTERLFWIDSYKEEVQSINYDGTDRRFIRRIENSQLYDFAIFRETLILTDIDNRQMYVINKTSGESLLGTISFDNEYVFSVAVYNEEKQPLREKDYCKELQCEQMCVSTWSGAKCECAEGFEHTTPGSNTCQVKPGTHTKGFLFANTTHICIIDIRALTTDYIDLNCIFTIDTRPPLTTPPTTTTTTTTTTPRPPTTTTTPAPMPDNTTTNSSDAQSDGHSTTPRPQASTQAPTTKAPTRPTTTPKPTRAPIPPGDMISKFDVDMIDRVIYFSDVNNNIYARPVDLPIDNTAKELVAQATGEITGLSYDWIDKVLYWCEEGGKIMRVNAEGVVSMVTNGINKPKELVAMAHERKLAWVTDSLDFQVMAMDGDKPTTLRSNIGEIASVVADHDAKLFYWLTTRGASSVWTMGFEGENFHRTTIPVEPTTYLFGVYKTYYKWVYNTAGMAYIKSNDKLDTGSHNWFMPPFIPIAMKVLDATLQPSEQSPCAYMNGGCQQVCVTEHTDDKWEKKCLCELGFTVSPTDSTRCISELKEDNFVLACDWTYHAMQQIYLTDNTTHTFQTDDTQACEGIYFDAETKRIIWGEYIGLYSANLDGTDHQLIGRTENFISRLDKCKTTGIIYHTTGESVFHHIGIITPSGYSIWLVEDTSYAIYGSVAVHPGKGWMFYTMWDGFDTGNVQRADMDGKNAQILVTAGEGAIPDGLCINFKYQMFYWSDSGRGTIWECDFDAITCTAFLETNTTVKDLATIGEYLYYADYSNDHIIEVHLKHRTSTVYGKDLGKLYSIAVYKSGAVDQQPENDACKPRGGLGDCSTLCLPTYSGRTCACEPGINLKDDERTCQNVYQCDEVIKQEKFVDIMFDSSCLRHQGDLCDYQCPYRYRKVNGSSALTCTNMGWDKQAEKLCEEFVCTGGINNAVIPTNCTRSVGEECEITCIAGYEKVKATATCTSKGTWDSDINYYCKPIMCTEPVIKYGSVKDPCTAAPNSACSFDCDRGYTKNPDVSTLMCTMDGKWNKDLGDLCIAQHCSLTLPYGIIEPTCTDRQLGRLCPYSCGTDKANSTVHVVCDYTYTWFPKDACQKVFTLEAPQALKSGDAAKVGFGVGIGICVLIIVALVIMIVFMLLRRKAQGNQFGYGRASFRSGGDIQLENPGYSGSDNLGSSKVEENPYDGINPDHGNGYTVSPNSGDDGFVNPMYANATEPVPESGEIKVTSGSAIPADNGKVPYGQWANENGKPH